MFKTVPFQIFNSNAKTNSFQLVRTAFPSFFLVSFPPLFFSYTRGFFSRCEGRDHWFHRSSVPDGRNYTTCFKDLLKNISEIYLQGGIIAKVQTVCLELSPLCSISTPPPPPARVIRGANTGAVQSINQSTLLVHPIKMGFHIPITIKSNMNNRNLK